MNGRELNYPEPSPKYQRIQNHFAKVFPLRLLPQILYFWTSHFGYAHAFRQYLGPEHGPLIPSMDMGTGRVCLTLS